MFSIISKILMAILPFPAQAATDASSSDIVYMAGKIEQVDPMDVVLFSHYEAYTPVHDTLFAEDRFGSMVAVIAEKWDFSLDRSALDITIQQNLKFSDNTLIDADSVVFSLSRQLKKHKFLDQRLLECIASSRFKNVPISSSIEKTGPFSIRLRRIDKCSSSIISILAEVPYGIIHPGSVDNYGKLLQLPTAVSGPYFYSLEGDDFVLRPNLSHRNWKQSDPPQPRNIRITPFREVSTSADKGAIVSFVKTSNHLVYQQFIGENYSALHSIPNVSWFITPKEHVTKHNLKITKQILDDLNANIDRSSLGSFTNNPLRAPSDSFFPKFIGCDFGHPKPKSSLSKEIRRGIKIAPVVVKDIYNPGGVSDEIDFMIRSLGYDVSTKYTEDPNSVKLVINAVNVSGSPLSVLRFVYDASDPLLSDPDGTIRDIMNEIGSQDLNHDDALVVKLCSAFSFHFYLPIGHSTSAFLHNNPDFSDLFNNVNGFVHLRRLSEKGAK